MAVAIFDSGLGGLTVYKAIAALMPELPLVYFGDSASAPYGERSAEDIYRLTAAATHKLWQLDCDLVILACNTASAIALRGLQMQGRPAEKHVLGVFVPMVEAITEQPWSASTPAMDQSERQVALFATPATVASRAFQRELASRGVGIDVETQPCKGLVQALEAGEQQRARALVFEHVAALKTRMPQPDMAVLGCTHYPLVQHHFESALGPRVRIYNQADLVAAGLKDYLRRHPNRDGVGRKSRFICTGNLETNNRLASDILGKAVEFELLR